MKYHNETQIEPMHVWKFFFETNGKDATFKNYIFTHRIINIHRILPLNKNRRPMPNQLL